VRRRRRRNRAAYQGDGFIRKQLRRLWRKVARQTSEDWRDAPPAVDSD
jgi:hypothetical protein